jgi:hypothetical protein
MSDIAGRIFPTPPQLRYVVLRHDGVPVPHFDLMVETSSGSELATWQSSHWPIETDTPLTRLPDHRRMYLDYEGPVSGDRGEVHRVASGRLRLDRRSDTLWRLTFRDLIAYSQLELRHESKDRWLAHPLRS